MSKTKLRISPLKDYRVQLDLNITEISKTELTEVLDSYLYEFKKVSKTGNDLSFSILFNKKYFSWSTLKEGNPSIAFLSANRLLTIKTTIIFTESDIKENAYSYLLKKELTGDLAFTLKFRATYSYFREKILLKRDELFNEKRYIEPEEEDPDLYFMPKLRRYDRKQIGIASENASRCCNNCMYLSDDFICGRHQQRVHKQNVCSSYTRPKFMSGGLASPK